MDRADVLKTIKNIINDSLDLNIEEIKEDTLLIIIGIDSIAMMSLIIYLEEEYNIEINFDDEMIMEFSNMTIGNLINSVLSSING